MTNTVRVNLIKRFIDYLLDRGNVQEASRRLPSWIYREKRPPNDDAYFENMTRVIFQAGLSWKMINKKWPNFKQAFENFSIEKSHAHRFLGF